MSALLSTADIHQSDGYASFVPITEILLSDGPAQRSLQLPCAPSQSMISSLKQATAKSFRLPAFPCGRFRTNP
jgi:hypothetical protein